MTRPAVRDTPPLVSRTGSERPEAWLKSMIEVAQGLPLPICISSSAVAGEQRVLYVNGPFCKLTGYTLEELEGDGLRVLNGKDTEADSKERLQNALRVGRAATVVLTSYNKASRGSRQMVRRQPVSDAAGTILYTLTLQLDIEAELERAAEFEQLAAKLPASISIDPSVCTSTSAPQDIACAPAEATVLPSRSAFFRHRLLPTMRPRFVTALPLLRFQDARMEARWEAQQIRRAKYLMVTASVIHIAYQVGFLAWQMAQRDRANTGSWTVDVGVAVPRVLVSFAAMGVAATVQSYTVLERFALVAIVSLMASVVVANKLRRASHDLALEQDTQAVLAVNSIPIFWLTQSVLVVAFLAGAITRARLSWVVPTSGCIFCAVYCFILDGYGSVVVERRCPPAGCAEAATVADWQLLVSGDDNVNDLIEKYVESNHLFEFGCFLVLGVFVWVGHCLQEHYQRTVFLRCDELEAANLALEEANDAQRREAALQHQRDRQLAATVFHEVRNPLNGVMGHLRLASRLPELSCTSCRALTDHLHGALGSTEIALEFLNTLTHIERLEAHTAQTLHPTAQQLGDLLEASGQIVRPQLRPGVSLLLAPKPPEGLHVMIDATVIKQVLINLMSNAAKHTHRGAVTLGCLAKGNDLFEFTVTDTGTGLSPDIKDSIFDRYRSIGGVGLGLHLTYHQVKSMGSSIQVVSPVTQDGVTAQDQPGSQFKFELRLPTAEPPVAGKTPSLNEAETPQAPALPPALAVLIADDAKTNRKLLRVAFERHCDASWSIAEARSAEEAVALYEATPFDLVVMDEVFEESQVADGPDKPMRGSEAIARIREVETARLTARKPACIISCTGHAALEGRKSSEGSCSSGGADAVWTKPFPDFTDGSMQRQLAELLA